MKTCKPFSLKRRGPPGVITRRKRDFIIVKAIPRGLTHPHNKRLGHTATEQEVRKKWISVNIWLAN